MYDSLQRGMFYGIAVVSGISNFVLVKPLFNGASQNCAPYRPKVVWGVKLPWLFFLIKWLFHKSADCLNGGVAGAITMSTRTDITLAHLKKTTHRSCGLECFRIFMTWIDKYISRSCCTEFRAATVVLVSLHYQERNTSNFISIMQRLSSFEFCI